MELLDYMVGLFLIIFFLWGELRPILHGMYQFIFPPVAALIICTSPL